jgi:hypothetical protein
MYATLAEGDLGPFFAGMLRYVVLGARECLGLWDLQDI